jgi:fumarate reductase subunit C
MTSVAMQVRLWYWQRVSAMVLALGVLVHLGVMIYAVRGGLTAAQILGRTHGSWGFGIFYSVFVVACAIHASIGLAGILEESLGWRGLKAANACRLFGLVLLAMGLRTVYGVVAA